MFDKANAFDPPAETIADDALVSKAALLDDSIARARQCLLSMQQDEGHWEGEVVWCPMLSAQYLICAYLMGIEVAPTRIAKIHVYFRAWQHEDGSFGLHAQSPGYLFVTTLVYVALRLTGVSESEDITKKAQQYIHRQGGAIGIPSWGKLWLALLGLYDWSGIYPILPELWLLPKRHFAHPRRYYCHTRLIYLPIGVLYGLRYTADLNPLLKSLREELYVQPYDSIDFGQQRNNFSETDIFAWPTLPVKAAYGLSGAVDRWAPDILRSRALKVCTEHIREHLRTSRFASISPVNGLLNTLALWAQDPDDRDAKRSFEGQDYWIWEDRAEGLRFNGARSQTWDTAFAVQALDASEGEEVECQGYLKAAQYFREHQMQDELRERDKYHRDIIRGGFCFSDRHHRWPVSDCTGEALAAIQAIVHRSCDHFDPIRIEDAVTFVLSRQNKDGGWGSYEKNRGNLVLETLNPSEMFGNCMVEHSYIECTASCIRGLVAAAKIPGPRPKSLEKAANRAIKKGVRFLLRAQKSDGSWPGFWGVNYTYGTMYGIQGLIDAGYDPSHAAIQKAREFLVRIQLPDGGWGERWESCVEERYIANDQSQVIQTAWAMMALIEAGEDRASVLRPAAGLLMSRQLINGDWPKEDVGGVFFNTAMHHYMMYKNIFPLWALGMYRTKLADMI